MKQVYLFLVMLFVANSVYSQDNEWYWNEGTKDVVYETPNSKFVKKWYRTVIGKPAETLKLLSNGTYKMTSSLWHDDYGFYSKICFSGTWKRSDKMTLEMRIMNISIVGDQTALSKLSARRRDEYNKESAEMTRRAKATYTGQIIKNPILRIDDDHLILRGNEVQKWYSEKRKKEYELQRQKEAEEARKAEDLRKAEEARKAEEEKILGKICCDYDEFPKFPGGPSAMSEYLSKNIKYPAEAEKNGIQGRVVLTYVVEKDGSLSQLKVAKGVDPSLDAEAIRVVSSMPKWIPAKKNGEIVRAGCLSLPVTFKLQ